VLYQAITRSAQSIQLDLLGLLRQCRRLNVNFTTQWATAIPTDCPSMPLDVTPISLAPQMASAAFMSTVRPGWSWQNLLQFGEAMAWKPYVYAVIDDIFGIKLVQILLGVFVGLPLMFPVANLALLRYSNTYRSLRQHLRLVTCQHSVYAALFGLSVVPQTWLALRALFSTWTGDLLATQQLTFLLGLFCVPRCALYLLEASVRSVCKVNTLLVAHRVIYVASGFAVVLSRSTAVLGMAVVIDLCAAHEAPLYLTLVSRRLLWPLSFTRTVLRGACAWYTITRIFQAVVLIYMVVGFAGMPAIRTTPAFIIMSTWYLAYSLGQVATLVIYRSIDRKLGCDNLPRPAAGQQGGEGADALVVDMTSGSSKAIGTSAEP